MQKHCMKSSQTHDKQIVCKSLKIRIKYQSKYYFANGNIQKLTRDYIYVFFIS